METYQHGDLIITEIAQLPKGLKDKGNNIVAEGEMTGHHHRVEGKVQVMVAEKPDYFKNVVFLKVSEPVTITHEEHKPIKLEPAFYKVEHVLEYDYFAEMSKQVRD